MNKKIYPKILTGIFVIIIMFMGVMYIFTPNDDFSETEKRSLAKFPTVTFERICDGSFSSDFEEYLADHAPFRSAFVSINAYFEYIKGNNGSSGIYLGKDGWLFEEPFEKDNIFDKNIAEINRFATSTDIPVSIIAVPSKGSIYSDYLPKVCPDYCDDEYTDRMIESLGKNVNVVDIRDTFRKEKDSTQLYYRTDHHWKSEAAYIAYNMFCLSKGMSAATKDCYTIETTENFYGTSYSKSCYTLTKPDTVEVYRNKETKGKAKVTIYDGTKQTNYDNMFFDDNLSGYDKYTVFLNGNHGRVDIDTGNEGGTLLLIKDSFGHCLAPFLAENYSKIIMIDLRYYLFDITDIIDDYTPDDILFAYSIENLALDTNIFLA